MISDEECRPDYLAFLEPFSEMRYGTRLTADDVVGALQKSRAERDACLGSPLRDAE